MISNGELSCDGCLQKDKEIHIFENWEESGYDLCDDCLSFYKNVFRRRNGDDIKKFIAIQQWEIVEAEIAKIAAIFG